VAIAASSTVATTSSVKEAAAQRPRLKSACIVPGSKRNFLLHLVVVVVIT
jgi:hypothetical protein